MGHPARRSTDIRTHPVHQFHQFLFDSWTIVRVEQLFIVVLVATDVRSADAATIPAGDRRLVVRGSDSRPSRLRPVDGLRRLLHAYHPVFGARVRQSQAFLAIHYHRLCHGIGRGCGLGGVNERRPAVQKAVPPMLGPPGSAGCPPLRPCPYARPLPVSSASRAYPTAESKCCGIRACWRCAWRSAC